ncbi:hypothetical protein [Microbacterium sp. NPDC056234]|uniref:hypothetical protein n=1 Tax=Microbacterium sp. NPDC056234 TaxID=3345757 RepID=UPI0035E230F7
MTSICFVSETGKKNRPIQDASVRYRCYHPAEVLTRAGDFCSVYSAHEFYQQPNFDYDVYVFHRPTTVRENFRLVQERLRKFDKTLIADYDDLIFGDAGMAIQSSAVRSGRLAEDRASMLFQQNLAGLREFDKVTTSTGPLAAWAKEFNAGAEVRVIPNLIPPSVSEVHNQLGTARVARPHTMIGYFSGSKSHDGDLLLVASVLHRVLIENPDYTLMLVGPVSLPASLAGLPNVMLAPLVDFQRLPGLMAKCSTVIAPLETSDFTACKSRVKFLEAALSGTRLLATPIPDMQVLGEERLGLLESLDDWYEELSAPVTRQAYSQQAERNAEFIRDVARVDELKGFWDAK